MNDYFVCSSLVTPLTHSLLNFLLVSPNVCSLDFALRCMILLNLTLKYENVTHSLPSTIYFVFYSTGPVAIAVLANPKG